MTAWKEIRHQVLDRIKNGISSIGRQRRSTTSGKSKNNSKGNNRGKKEISPQEMVAIIGSVVIIITALGGLGLVYNVFAQLI